MAESDIQEFAEALGADVVIPVGRRGALSLPKAMSLIPWFNERQRMLRDKTQVWRTERDGTTSWAAKFRIGRFQFLCHVHRHRSHLPDRWVLQPSFTYDRKR
jgi:hypothetical protein